MAPLQGAAARCCCKVLVSECCLRFGAWLLLPLQGAAAGCRCRVPLQGAAIAGPAAECCCRGTLELGRWSFVAGAAAKCRCIGAVAAAGCRCKVLVLERCLRFGAWLLMPLEGPRCRCELQKPGPLYRSQIIRRLLFEHLLQGAAVRVPLRDTTLTTLKLSLRFGA